MLIVLFGLTIQFNEVSAARALNQRENEALCDRFGENLERKFVVNPRLLVQELDLLIAALGAQGPNRISHDKSGRKLASIGEPPRTKVAAALEIRVHNKLTEANKLITQTKQLGFFDEDEERAPGVQDTCAKMVYERAMILEGITRRK